MISSLKWVLRMTQKSHLSSLGCLFSHSAEWPGHTSSHSSNAVPHLVSLSALSCAFKTWCRRSRLITRHSVIASALTCHLTCFSTCVLAFLPVASWEMSLLCLTLPITPCVLHPILSNHLENLAPASVLQFLPFSHTSSLCPSSVD